MQNVTTPDTGIMDIFDYETFIQIIANIPSCIFFKDTDLKYRFSSHYWMQLNTDNVYGKTDLDIRKDTENAIKAMEADRSILESKKGLRYTIKSDIDGEVSYLELIKEPIILSDGTVVGIVGLINDVTEKTIMEKKIVGMSEMLEVQCRELETSNTELKSTLERIEKMHESQKIMTASMNHELRSPLNGIIGSLELIMDDSNLTQTQRDSIHNAYQSSQLMLEIVNELLDLARLEMKGFTFKHEPFALSDILSNIEYSSKTLAAAKGLQFKIEKEPGMPDVFVGDDTKLKQIMFNFTSNAVKYTDEGSITLSVSYRNGNLVIACADTGQGIAEDAISSLFDPYVRLEEKKNSHIQGTGLGLSVVKKIVEGMKGELNVTSRLNEGSVFTAKIPVDLPSGEVKITSSDTTSSDTRSEKMGIVKPLGLSTLSALCIDDSSVNAVIMANILKKEGLTADVAYSAREGIGRADLKKYDIIFMDHFMPEMSGIEAFDVIRKYSVKNRNTPVVMLTGNADPEDIRLYKKHGFNGYLTKPILKEAILDMIYSVVK